MSETTVHASAPGKVVLCGEYAVLDGAPAVCMAINRRVRVSITASKREFHTVIAPGHVDEITAFRVTNGKPEWPDHQGEFELLEHIWRESGFEPGTGIALKLDSAGFSDPVHGCKLGIGSSAALAVALSAAIHEWQPRDRDPLDAAYRGHLAFQNGRGSGVDIASAHAGGLIEYSMKGRVASDLEMPDGLECRFVSSGSQASTGKKLEHYSRHGELPSRAALAYSAKRMAEVWRAGEPGEILREYRGYVHILQEFSVDHDLGVFDAGHAELADAAEAEGLVYKPCGAGGGDIGMIIATKAELIDEFLANHLPGQFRMLDLGIDSQGVEVTTE